MSRQFLEPQKFLGHVRTGLLAACCAALPLAWALAWAQQGPAKATEPKRQSANAAAAACPRGHFNASPPAAGPNATPFAWAVSAAFARDFCVPPPLTDLPFEGRAAIAYRANPTPPPPRPGMSADAAAFEALDIGHVFEIYFDNEIINLGTNQRFYSARRINSMDDAIWGDKESVEWRRLAIALGKEGKFFPLFDHFVEFVVRLPGVPDEPLPRLQTGYLGDAYVGLDAVNLSFHAGFTRNRIPPGTSAELLWRVRGPTNRYIGPEIKNPPVVFEIPLGKRLSALVISEDQKMTMKQEIVNNNRIKEITK